MMTTDPAIASVAKVLCKSGKFETGQGTCAPICMEFLGDPRKSGCAHATRVFEKLAADCVAAAPLALSASRPASEGVSREAIDALRPFASAASGYESFDGQHDFDEDFVVATLGFTKITVGHLRDARQALAKADAIIRSFPLIGAALPVRAEVAAFALLMEQQLRANDHKPGWKGDDPFALLYRVREETIELEQALDQKRKHGLLVLEHLATRFYAADISLIAKEAADVANFAMMIADVCGALPAPSSPVQVAEDVVERLREALEPFAELGRVWSKDSERDDSPWTQSPDDTKLIVGKADIQWNNVTVGQLRQAYAALSASLAPKL